MTTQRRETTITPPSSPLHALLRRCLIWSVLIGCVFAPLAGCSDDAIEQGPGETTDSGTPRPDRPDLDASTPPARRASRRPRGSSRRLMVSAARDSGSRAQASMAGRPAGC